MLSMNVPHTLAARPPFVGLAAQAADVPAVFSDPAHSAVLVPLAFHAELADALKGLSGSMIQPFESENVKGKPTDPRLPFWFVSRIKRLRRLSPLAKEWLQQCVAERLALFVAAWPKIKRVEVSLLLQLRDLKADKTPMPLVHVDDLVMRVHSTLLGDGLWFYPQEKKYLEQRVGENGVVPIWQSPTGAATLFYGAGAGLLPGTADPLIHSAPYTPNMRCLLLITGVRKPHLLF